MAQRSGALDTNVILDWLFDRDAKRFKRIEQLLQAGTDFHISDIVFLEIVYILEKYYDLTRSEITRNLSVVMNEPKFTCRRGFLLHVIAIYATERSLSFADCYLLKESERIDSPLWTFDRKLVKHSGGRAKLLK